MGVAMHYLVFYGENIGIKIYITEAKAVFF